MAVFKRLTREQIKNDYDHYALMFGIVPIYVGDVNGECRVAVRNWIPEWTLDVADSIFSVCVSCMEFMNPDYEPMFFLKVGKEIE